MPGNEELMKNTVISRLKNTNPWVIFFELFVITQLMLIFIFNLTHLKYEAGFDSSAAMAQAMEIWNQKTIFLKNWEYQSTLGLDSVIIPASIFYGITHNIFLAYGIADCLGVMLYIYIFRDIFKMLKLPKLPRMIIYVLLLTPYSLEPLGYMPMMFTGAAYYIIKVLIPIMLIDLILKLRFNIPVKKYLHILITYFVSIYLTALSCGLYLLICGLFPIIIYELYCTICSGSLRNIINKRSLLLLISLIIYAAGYVSAKIYGASVFTNEMILSSVNNFVNNLAKCFVGIAELFGALPSKDIRVTSAFGIHYLSHMAAFIIVIIIVVATIKALKPLSGLIIQSGDNKADKIVTGQVCCIIAVNLAVLILTDTTYGSESFEFRYHLIPVVASFLIIGIGIDRMIKWLKEQKNRLIFTSVMTVISIIWILNNIVFVYYYSSRNSYNTSEAIVKYVENNTDYKKIYFLGDSDSEIIEVSRIARLIESDLTIVDGPFVGTYIGWGTSNKHFIPTDNIDRMVLVCTPTQYENIEPRIQYSIDILDEIDGYIIFEVPAILTDEQYEELIEEIENEAGEDESYYIPYDSGTNSSDDGYTSDTITN